MTGTNKEQAIELLQTTDKSKTEIANELGISKQSVAAYEAHMTMGTYDQGTETMSDSRPSVSRERDVEEYLAQHISDLEDGLRLQDSGQQVQTDVGRIDLLAKDDSGNEVVIEIKKGTAKDSALGQLLGYMEDRRSQQEQPVRGLIVAEQFSSRLQTAVKRFDSIDLVSFQVDYSFHRRQGK